MVKHVVSITANICGVDQSVFNENHLDKSIVWPGISKTFRSTFIPSCSRNLCSAQSI